MQHAILAAIGMIVITTTWRGLYLNFVKPGLRWWLILAGAVVLAMGIYGVLTEDAAPPKAGASPDSAPEQAEEPADIHSHHGPRIGWLLLVPFLVMSVLAPPSLGAFSAERDTGAVRTTSAQVATLPRLPATTAPVPMTLGDFSVRAVFDQGRTLKTNRVRLVGFVSARPTGGTGPNWYLTRMAMSCCAADGYAIKIDVRGGGRDLPKNAWLAVTGRWVHSAGRLDEPGTLAALQIESVQAVNKPAQPYE